LIQPKICPGKKGKRVKRPRLASISPEKGKLDHFDAICERPPRRQSPSTSPPGREKKRKKREGKGLKDCFTSERKRNFLDYSLRKGSKSEGKRSWAPRRFLLISNSFQPKEEERKKGAKKGGELLS